mmetsp:Transcript_25723/g.38226  ORF Transcript_25723/g.38226 Transcript_25723/m.38226 type:complete len:93 (+) Transcript_25723:1505-1783(+)
MSMYKVRKSEGTYFLLKFKHSEKRHTGAQQMNIKEEKRDEVKKRKVRGAWQKSLHTLTPHLHLVPILQFHPMLAMRTNLFLPFLLRYHHLLF